MRRKISNLCFFFIFLPFIFSACATTTSELMDNIEKMQSWVTIASCEKTFRVFKEYAEEKYDNNAILWSGTGVQGYFYGESAELSIKMENNPMAKITYLHFELEKNGENTIVKAWYYNFSWKKSIQKFKDLLPIKEMNIN